MKNLYLFDCFGVVVTDVSGVWMKDRFNDEEKQYIVQKIFRSVDTGKISQQEMFNELSERYGISVETMWKDWEQVLKVKWDTIELICKLREQGGTVALLSNASVEYIDYIFDKFDLRKYFDKLFVSARYGVAKPDAEFYQLCVNDFADKFDKIYFTDDNPVNLRDLEQFGITPILFTDARKLAKKLALKG